MPARPPPRTASDQPHDREGFEDSVTAALQSVLARVEAYPDLKASANFLDLQRS